VYGIPAYLAEKIHYAAIKMAGIFDYTTLKIVGKLSITPP
jgi:hypothetical protein